MSIVLKREQIEKLIDVYNHFKDIETFTISLEEDSDMISINFSINDVKTDHEPKDKSDKPFKPLVYK